MTHDTRHRVMQLIQQERFKDADKTLEQLCLSNTEDSYLWFLRGAVNGRLNRFSKAKEYCEHAVYLNPDFHDAWFNLAQAYTQLEEQEKAISAYLKISNQYPAYCTVLCNIGLLLQRQGHLQSAVESHRKALNISPDNIENLVGLGKALMLGGDIHEAEACYKKALRSAPGHVSANNHLGHFYSLHGLYTQASSCFNAAIKSDPGSAESHINLALSLSAQARHTDAEKHFLKALDIDPSSCRARSAYLFSLNYYKEDRVEIAEEHKRWAPASACTPHPIHKPCNTSRRLKIGYISQDFRKHSVASFIEPVLEAHSKAVVDIYCYADIANPDNTTERLKRLSHHWRDIHAMPTEHSSKLIREDGIDILIELGGHTSHELLPVLSERPAPVQITYLGYPNTTGMSSIDYRITDTLSDPEPEADLTHSEKLIRMPNGFLCYRPEPDSPNISLTPYLKNNEITFGSFNKFSKVTEKTIKCWASILNAVENSKIILKSDCFSDKAFQNRVHDIFSKYAIGKSRILLMEKTPEQNKHLETYNRIDIALDPFPYNGTTTTCEALWMGVPVITLLGNTHAGRVGSSILRQTGLGEWCAESTNDYIETAIKLGSDVFLQAYDRENTRRIMARSALCDNKTFTHELESIYLSIWKSRFAQPVNI